MRIKKSFGRIYSKVRPSSISMSSSPPSFVSVEDNDNNCDTDRHINAEGFGRRRRRRLSWWKRSSSNEMRTRGGRNKKKETSSKEKTHRNNNDDNIDYGANVDGANNTTDNGQSMQPPPSELQQAIHYFDIATKDSFNREDVKKKYKRLSLIHHPDRNGNEEQSIREMQKINHYFELLEEELDRLEESIADSNKRNEVDPPLSTGRSSTNNNSCREDSSDGNAEEKRDDTQPKSSQHSSDQRSRSIFTPLSKTTDSESDAFRHCKSKPPEKQWQGSGMDNFEDKTVHYHEEKSMKTNTLPRLNNFRKNQRKFRRTQNSWRSVPEQVEMGRGRGKANKIHRRQVQVNRNETESFKRSVTLPRFAADGSMEVPTISRHPLMDCCKEDIVVAMQLGQTKIAIEIVDREVNCATEQWARAKTKIVVATDAAQKACKTSPGSTGDVSVKLDKGYRKVIFGILTRPLDKEQNTVLHYAVYLGDHQMINHLAQIARRYKFFSSFVVCTNDLNLMAYDYLDRYKQEGSIISTLVSSLTIEALNLLEEKERKRVTCHQNEETNFEYQFVDPLFEVCLCFLEGLYVAHSGWFISLVIIALAHIVETGKTKADFSSDVGGNDNTNSATSGRVPKAAFFALHTGYYLVTAIFFWGKELIATLRTNILVPWQLQLVTIVATVLYFTDWNHWLLLRYMARTMIETISALAAGFDWILPRNAQLSVSHLKLSNSGFVGYIQTIFDFMILTIPFLVVQLLCSTFYS